MLASLADSVARLPAWRICGRAGYQPDFRPKILKKCLAMPAAIVRRGVILRALGGYMRKFKRFPRRGLRFRSLLILAGALLLLAAFAPSANADVIAYFNFEDAIVGGPPDFTSEFDQGLGVNTTMITDFKPSSMSSVSSTFTDNKLPDDMDPSLIGLGLRRTANSDPANFDIPLISAQGIFDVTSVSFAVNINGNGFLNARVGWSFDGVNFTFTAFQNIPTSGVTVMNFTIPAGTTLNQPNLTIRIQFTNGGPGNYLQQTLDNVLIGGTIVPEPATVAGGLLGVVGLCFHQRRRLLRSVPFGRASE